MVVKMNYSVEKEKFIANGSYYQSNVVVDYMTLVELFGESMGSSADGKCQAEWQILFDDGLVGTIYDWKEYDTAVEFVTDWHLGGVSEVAPNRVKELIKNFIDSKGLVI